MAFIRGEREIRGKRRKSSEVIGISRKERRKKAEKKIKKERTHDTGIVTAFIISFMILGSLMRATPPVARMSAGIFSKAITA